MQSRIRKCSREFGSAVESIEVQSRVEKFSRECRSAVESIEMQSRIWKCSRVFGSAVESAKSFNLVKNKLDQNLNYNYIVDKNLEVIL